MVAMCVLNRVVPQRLSHAKASAYKTTTKPDLRKIHGRIQFVTHFPDYTVKVVDHFPDLRVRIVEHFADEAGEWEIVDHFPDYRIQIVDHFPDFTIQWVEHFPGVD